MPNLNYFSSQFEIFDMGRDAGQKSMNSKFAPDVFKYSLNYFVGDYQAVGFNQPFGNWQNEPDIAQDLANKQLYNGNIRAMYVQAPNVKNALHFYKYDALNRISHSFSYEKAKVNRWFSNNNITKRYQTDYDYDGAGNLSHLTRKDQAGNTFDNFSYHYDATNKNRLLQVTDAVGINIKPDDFDSQVNADNYVYDLLGRVVEDKAKNLTQTYNKENKIVTQTIGSKVITYKYDFQSKRVSKTVVNGALTTTEFYVRDPQGNVLAIYADTLQNGRKFTLSELHLYGSSRLGTYKVDSVLWENGTTATSSNKYSFKLGQKRYELNNHLGNVHVTITDRKIIQGNGQNAYFIADVQSVTDYYPFGKTISERTWSVSKTRYDFNGKETDEESGYQDYGFRDYDVEIARFLQVDPLYRNYPWYSVYQFAGNKPIVASDLDGLEERWEIFQRQKDLTLLNKQSVYETERTAFVQLLYGVLQVVIPPVGVQADVQDLGESIAKGDKVGIVINAVGFLPLGDFIKWSRNLIGEVWTKTKANKIAYDKVLESGNINDIKKHIEKFEIINEELKLSDGSKIPIIGKAIVDQSGNVNTRFYVNSDADLRKVAEETLHGNKEGYTLNDFFDPTKTKDNHLEFHVGNDKYKVEYAQYGEKNMDEGSHVKIQIWNPNKGKNGKYENTEKIFIKGRDNYNKTSPKN